MLLVAPYIWYLHVHTGQWMISGKTNITWRAGGWRDEGRALMKYTMVWTLPERRSIRYPLNVFKATLGTVIAEPSRLVKRVIRSAGSLKENFFTRTNFWWGLTPLLILGLFREPWSSQRLRYEAFLLTIIAVL